MDNIEHWIFTGMLAIGCVVLAAVAIVYEAKLRDLRTECVLRGQAEWHVEPDGGKDPLFRWKTPAK